ncbi:MAG: hypothetical protein ABI068_15810 [Ktedonobacterales bacterium]
MGTAGFEEPARQSQRQQHAGSRGGKTHGVRASQTGYVSHASLIEMIGDGRTLYQAERRRAPLAQALRRLEREHVALLLAICELESPTLQGDELGGMNTSPELRQALLPLLQGDLRRAQHALERASLGLYGACEVCSSPIALRRLETQPATTHCAGCESPRHHTPLA